MNCYAEVVFPLPLSRSFTYLLPAELRPRARVGCRVTAPLGTRSLTGFIVHLRTQPPASAAAIKEIRALLDEEPAFTLRFLAFARLLSRRYASSWGELLAASLPPSFIPRERAKLRLTKKGEAARGEGLLSRGEVKLADYLAGSAYSPLYLRRKLGKNVSATLGRMRAKGLVEAVPEKPAKHRRPGAKAPSDVSRQMVLDFPPAAGIDRIVAEILRPSSASRPYPYLFLGGRVGREAVYETLVQAAWSAGGRVLFLIPEISSAGDFLKRYEEKRPGCTAVFHSRLSPRQKEDRWAKIRSGLARVVAGPRSALFLPLSELRLVILEDEQDESFLQEESPSFDARPAAVLLGRAMGAAAVFGSAWPSVESYYEADSNGRLIRLEAEPRPGRVRLVDVRRERSYLSRELIEAVTARSRVGEKIIVFLNRRGFAATVVCSRCGQVPRCGRCRIPLFYLKQKNSLVCRYCSSSRPAPQTCPECGGPLRLGREPGVEAVQEELKRLFPRLRIALFDSDAVGSPAAQGRTLDQFRRGRIDLLVGTQLLAHQNQAPPASLVAVLNPESQLGVPDYRSGQRAFHTLCRMMGFASGRGSEVIIQTALPEHHAPAAAARGDYGLFYRTELEFRRMMKYPPFFHLAEVFFEGRDLRLLGRQARDFRDRALRLGEEVEVLGPSRAVGFRPRGLERVLVLLRAARRDALHGALDTALPRTRAVGSVRVYP